MSNEIHSAALSERLSEKQHKLVLFCEQFYLLNQRLPVYGNVKEYGYDRTFFSDCLKNSTFNKCLELRGLTPYTSLNSKGNPPAYLSGQQLEAANCMLDLRDNRSQKNKLKDLGVSSQLWETWLRVPAFNKYLKLRSEQILGDNSFEAHLSLVDRVRSGDLGAIKYYNEITGRYVPAANKGQVDIQVVLYQVLEIVQQLVPDVEVQAAIAKRLMGLAEPIAARYDDKALVPQELASAAGRTILDLPALETGPIDFVGEDSREALAL